MGGWWGRRMWAGSTAGLAGTRGVREVRAVGDGDGIGEADGCLILPVALRSAPGKGMSAGLGIPQGATQKIGGQVFPFHGNQARRLFSAKFFFCRRQSLSADMRYSGTAACINQTCCISR